MSRDRSAAKGGVVCLEGCCVGVAKMSSLVVVVGADIDQIITGPSMRQRDRGTTKAVRRYNGMEHYGHGRFFPLVLCVARSIYLLSF